MPQNDERREYCRQQAAQCAAAAAAATVAHVREAYLDMEQAWLRLAPGIEDTVPVGPSSQPRDDDLTAEPKRQLRPRPILGGRFEARGAPKPIDELRGREET
jgi:hypothetical protein